MSGHFPGRLHFLSLRSHGPYYPTFSMLMVPICQVRYNMTGADCGCQPRSGQDKLANVSLASRLRSAMPSDPQRRQGRNTARTYTSHRAECRLSPYRVSDDARPNIDARSVPSFSNFHPNPLPDALFMIFIMRIPAYCG